MEKKEYIPQTFKLRADLVRRLDESKRETGVPKTVTVEKALDRYLDGTVPSKQ